MLLSLLVAAQTPDLETSVKHLTALSTRDLSWSLTYYDPSPEMGLGEGVALTERFPGAASAWVARGRCEMRAAKFAEARTSFERARGLGAAEGKALDEKARAHERTASSLTRWGAVDQLSAEGGGYWIAACTKTSMGPRTLLEVRPNGEVKPIAAFQLIDANFMGFTFGFRDLDGDRRPELIAESYTWLSNGGDCAVRVFKGSRGSWRQVLSKEGLLWDVPIVDLDGDGVYKLAIHEFVWYKGPTLTRVYRLRRGKLLDVTRSYPSLIRRQLETLRKDLAQLDPERREVWKDRIEAARRLFRGYGYRL